MEGTPTPQRERDPESLIDLNHAPGLPHLRASIIAMVSNQLQQANVFIALANEVSGELRFEGPELWLDSFLQRHALTQNKTSEWRVGRYCAERAFHSPSGRRGSIECVACAYGF